jgi:hypothetical protein
VGFELTMLVAIGTDFIVNVNPTTMRQPLSYNEIMHNFSDQKSSYDRLIIVDTNQNYFYNIMFFSFSQRYLFVGSLLVYLI